MHKKKYITIRIAGLGIRTLVHAASGKDGRPTKSFKLSEPVDRLWWKAHRHQVVQVELLATDSDIVKENFQPSNAAKKVEVIPEVKPTSPQVQISDKVGVESPALHQYTANTQCP